MASRGRKRGIEAGRAYVKGTWDDSAIVRGIKGTGRRIKALGTKMLGLGTAMAGVFAPMVKAAADAEKAAIGFEVLTGSAEKAAKVMADLNKFAMQTPYSMPELTDATRKLLAFGVAQEDILDSLRAVGDVAAGIDAPIGEIAEIYGKAKVQGRLFMEDINQLTGRGIPIIQELANQFGVAESDVRGLVSSGQVNFSHLEAAFQSLTSEGGKFGGMMERLSGSAGGKWSKLMDTLAASGRAIGGALLPVLKPLLDRAIQIAEKFAAWAKDNSALTTTLAGVAAGIAATGGVLWAVGSLATVLAGPVGLIVLVAALTAALMKAAEAYGLFGTSAADAARQQALLRKQLDQGAASRQEQHDARNAEAIEGGPESVDRRRDELRDQAFDLQRQIAEQGQRIERMKSEQGWLITQGEEDALQTQIDHLTRLSAQLDSVVSARQRLEGSIKQKQDAAAAEIEALASDAVGSVRSIFDKGLGTVGALAERAEDLGLKPKTTKSWLAGLFSGATERPTGSLDDDLHDNAPDDRSSVPDSINTAAIVGTVSGGDALAKAMSGRGEKTTQAVLAGNKILGSIDRRLARQRVPVLGEGKV